MWSVECRLGRVRGVRDGGRGWLLACLPACVCLGLDVIAWVPLVCGPGVCVKVCVVLRLWSCVAEWEGTSFALL